MGPVRPKSGKQDVQTGPGQGRHLPSPSDHLFFGVVGALLGYNYEKREALAPRVGATTKLVEFKKPRFY